MSFDIKLTKMLEVPLSRPLRLLHVEKRIDLVIHALIHRIRLKRVPIHTNCHHHRSEGYFPQRDHSGATFTFNRITSDILARTLLIHSVIPDLLRQIPQQKLPDFDLGEQHDDAIDSSHVEHNL